MNTLGWIMSIIPVLRIVHGKNRICETFVDTEVRKFDTLDDLLYGSNANRFPHALVFTPHTSPRISSIRSRQYSGE